jgi:hypothetical protein
MPAVAPVQITLSQDHKDNFLQIGVDLAVTLIHRVDNHAINATAPIDGYTTGHYLFFISGAEEQHRQFCKLLYQTQQEPFLALKAPGLWVYAAATAKFMTPENLVTLSYA